jgi:hypothetical protein
LKPEFLDMIERRASEVEPHDSDTLGIGAVIGNLNAHPDAPAKTSRVITPDRTVWIEPLPASMTNSSFMKAL